MRESNQIHDVVGYLRVNHNVRGKSGGAINYVIESKFSLDMAKIPWLRLVHGKAMEHITKSTVNNFGLPIGLWVMNSTNLETSIITFS